MGRMVRAAAPPAQARRKAGTKALAGGGEDSAGDETQKERGDGYLDRVAKYVPAEVIAFFIFVNSIVGSAIDKGMVTAMETEMGTAMETGMVMMNASNANLNDRPRASSTNWVTLPPLEYEVPKSKVKTRFNDFKYCSITGRSVPNRWLYSATFS